MTNAIRKLTALAFLVFLAAGAAACSDMERGGITARIVFPDLPAQSARRAGLSHQGLRAEGVLPPEIGRLQITALDVAGSTLAETNLTVDATDPDLRLMPEGGTWRLDRVPIGKDRQIAGHAYLGANPDPRIGDLLLFAGRIGGIEVRSGEVANAGTLEMRLVQGVRYPPLDEDPPDSPGPANATVVPEGEALLVNFTRPPQEDLAGYLIAVGTGVSTPTIARGYLPGIGEVLGGDIKVRQQLLSPVADSVTVDGLPNRVGARVLVYAYDADLEGRPLNYSRPVAVFGIPEDRSPPAAPTNLTATAAGMDAITFSFTSPGEDGDMGTPDRYEVKASTSRMTVETVSSFELLRGAMPPSPRAGGEQVSFTRTFEELAIRPTDSFFLGVRAIDADGNKGAIGVVGFTVTTTLPPALTAVAPAIATVGRSIHITGSSLGARAGALTIVTSTAPLSFSTLMVTSWSPTAIDAILPAQARSGVLTVTRAGDALTASTFLPVLLRVDAAFPVYDQPYELLATATGTIAVGALYREVAQGGASFEGAVERTIGESVESPARLPLLSDQRSTAIGGTRLAQTGQFYFVASNQPTTMTAALISTATTATTASDLRITTAVLGAGNADRVAVVELDATGPIASLTLPAMLAFSAGGSVRTSTVNDVRVDPFDTFITVTSSTATTSYDRVTLVRNEAGELLMAYRAITAAATELVLLDNATQSPAGFTPISVATRPSVGSDFELLALPGPSAGLAGFAVVYEQIDGAGRSDIRVLRASDYGTKLGYAPFELDLADWRLEDAGLVTRQHSVWIAVLATKIGAGTEARYTELPLTALDFMDSRRGEHPGVTLDNTSLLTRARIGCKEGPLFECPFVWLGGATQTLYFRR